MPAVSRTGRGFLSDDAAAFSPLLEGSPTNPEPGVNGFKIFVRFLGEVG